MKFEADSTDPEVISHGIVSDALDRILPHSIRGDIHTGWVHCMVLDSNDQIVIDHDKGESKKVWRRYLTPLGIDQHIKLTYKEIMTLPRAQPLEELPEGRTP